MVNISQFNSEHQKNKNNFEDTPQQSSKIFWGPTIEAHQACW